MGKCLLHGEKVAVKCLLQSERIERVVTCLLQSVKIWNRLPITQWEDLDIKSPLHSEKI